MLEILLREVTLDRFPFHFACELSVHLNISELPRVHMNSHFPLLSAI